MVGFWDALFPTSESVFVFTAWSGGILGGTICSSFITLYLLSLWWLGTMLSMLVLLLCLYSLWVYRLVAVIIGATFAGSSDE